MLCRPASRLPAGAAALSACAAKPATDVVPPLQTTMPRIAVCRRASRLSRFAQALLASELPERQPFVAAFHQLWRTNLCLKAAGDESGSKKHLRARSPSQRKGRTLIGKRLAGVSGRLSPRLSGASGRISNGETSGRLDGMSGRSNGDVDGSSSRHGEDTPSSRWSRGSRSHSDGSERSQRFEA
jgi:hypothetical protein